MNRSGMRCSDVVKRIVTAVAAAAILASMAPVGANAATAAAPGGAAAVSSGDAGRSAPKISVFATFVKRIAKERGWTLAQAADSLYGIGVRGVDVDVRDLKVAEAIAATKLRIINFYCFPRMFDDAQFQQDLDLALAQAKRYAVPRIMVVPSHFTKDGDQEAEFEKDLAAMKRFVAAAKAQGVKITVEDFGGPCNPGSYMKYLKRFLDEIPDIRFALDSGNLYYAGRGESILDMMAYARGRIEHVHLKDQTEEDNRRYETLGLGAVPNREIVTTLAREGYDGWYTLENTVGDTLEDTVRQVGVLRLWIGE